jgi:hypothetical protein
MKIYLRVLIVLIYGIFLSLSVKAQETKNKPVKKWVSENGYWVIEGNIHSPKSNTLYCYNDEDSLIYTEKLVGIKINTNRRATLKKLNRVLNKSLIAWNAARISSEAQAPATAILQNQ